MLEGDNSNTYGLFPGNSTPPMVILVIDPCAETRIADVRVAMRMDSCMINIMGSVCYSLRLLFIT